MYEWIAAMGGLSALAAILVFAVALALAGYQFCQYCREENLPMGKGFARLYKKFLDDFNSSFPGPRT